MDLISRQAAIDCINKQREHLRPDIYPQDKIGDAAYRICAEFIERLPSVQPVAKDTNVPSTELISRQAAIDVDGLDEEIRCEMCRNPMHTDRGCDGNCKYDEKLYEKIMQILSKRIKPLPSAQPEREPAKFIRWMECKKTDKYISYTPHCKCSKCGNELLIEAINYCYMCGAKMDGERRTDERKEISCCR